jgi:hypothetical protein
MVVPPYLYNRSLLLALLTCAFDCFQFCLSLSPLTLTMLVAAAAAISPLAFLASASSVHINTSTHAYPPPQTHARSASNLVLKLDELLISDDPIDLCRSSHHVSQPAGDFERC